MINPCGFQREENKQTKSPQGFSCLHRKGSNMRQIWLSWLLQMSSGNMFMCKFRQMLNDIKSY